MGLPDRIDSLQSESEMMGPDKHGDRSMHPLIASGKKAPPVSRLYFQARRPASCARRSTPAVIARIGVFADDRGESGATGTDLWTEEAAMRGLMMDRPLLIAGL